MMSNPSLSAPDSGGPPEAAQVRRYFIIGERRFSNYWWACVILLGAFGFLMTGFASYLGHSVFVFNANNDINFFPQGLLMSFYGSLGLLLSLYWWLLIF